MGNNQFADRIGEENYNNQGHLMQIVKYNNAKDIIIEFQDDCKTKVKTAYSCFRNGSVKNSHNPIISGFGYIGNGNYMSRKDGKITPQYQRWDSMIKRCYDEKYLLKRPTYKDCDICDEWKSFQTFAKWYDENYYECGNEKMHLDKDILIKNNKIYSPQTCIFTPKKINMLFENCKNARGKYPVGVSLAKNNKFRAYHTINYKQISLGVFNTPNEAFLAHKQAKERYIKQIADEYKSKYPQFPKELCDAMYNYKIEIDD